MIKGKEKLKSTIISFKRGRIAMSMKFTGIGASSGIAMAKAFVMKEQRYIIEKKQKVNVGEELQKWQKAIDQGMKELKQLQEVTEQKLGSEEAAIFASHLLVLQDPEFVDAVQRKIREEQVNAEFALQEIANMFIAMFENIDDDYMKERAADVKDVTKRIMNHLLGIKTKSLAAIQEDVIIVAEDLTPSETAQLNPMYVKGFVTDVGGRTSHSAIMARTLEIPAVVGTKDITKNISDGMILIINGDLGEVIVDPTMEEQQSFAKKQLHCEERKKELANLVNEPTMTMDGYRVELAANIGTPNDLEGILKNGAEGVGLYRTEFLYLGKNKLPSEEEQFQAYKMVLERLERKPVVIRTLDIGGDKELPYLNFPDEQNPFLGYRAIRLCLDQTAIFRTQLRSLLRASVFGNLKVMFPMITTMEELRQAKQLFAEEREKLLKEKVAISDQIEIGIMIETPAAAVCAEQFVKEVDFFSIGTNDLIQYTMAADRMNERVSYLYQPYHPAILRFVKMVIDAAHQHGKWVGMCGEMAGDEIAIPLLIGLGIDELSMSAASILRARSQICSLSKEKLEAFVQEMLKESSAETIEQATREQFIETNPLE